MKTVTGKVIDKSTGQPMMLVNVMDVTAQGIPTGQGTTTNENGSFGYTAKSNHVGFRHVGCTPVIFDVNNVPSNVMLNCNKQLSTVTVRPKKQRDWFAIGETIRTTGTALSGLFGRGRQPEVVQQDQLATADQTKSKWGWVILVLIILALLAYLYFKWKKKQEGSED